MSEFEKLQLLKEAMAYYGNGVKKARKLLIDTLYPSYINLYALELAVKLADQYKVHFKIISDQSFGNDELYSVVDFIKDNHSGEKNV